MEKLKNTPTHPSKKEKDHKKKYKAKTEKLLKKIKTYQNQMYAQNKYSMLIVFQGMDASGKDGSVKHVFGSINPMGCQVTGFKKPSQEEAAHDFLWRIHQHTPEKGMIQIFNRSHYEDVIVPTINGHMSKKQREHIYTHINNFEALLADNNTVVLKFLLHIGQEAQDEKLRERLTNPTKHWKHNDDDRSKKDKYNNMLTIYDEMIEETNTKNAPWMVIPTDKNRYKEYLIADAVVDAFEKRMKLERPDLETDMTIIEIDKD